MSKVRLLLFNVVLLVALTSIAQPITQIKIGVNGLTCSACTRSVEMSLLRLDFVDSVAMSLENTEGQIFTKALSPIDFFKIAKAVTDAGFSVRFLQANFSLKNIALNDNGCFIIGGSNFQWIGAGQSTDPLTLTFVDAPFLPGNQYSKWKKKFGNQSCIAGQPAFHVTHASL